jgi:hypothetical protein
MNEIEEKIHVEGIVRKGFGVKPGEAIKDAAKRAIHSPNCTLPQRRAWQLLFDEGIGPADPWARMRKAAECFGEKK